uniref:Transposon Ty3-I Gag-Pol polyprotein n=1 Tax=Cajanus cajan TaxID=3821 RepID=A0A151QPQ2_CAJCA|nr:Transposon Ty3-I Gag-Pol polyprotein [Cajanus cajan]
MKHPSDKVGCFRVDVIDELCMEAHRTFLVATPLEKTLVSSVSEINEEDEKEIQKCLEELDKAKEISPNFTCVQDLNKEEKSQPQKLELKQLPSHLKYVFLETRKDHFPLPFMDQMLERLLGQAYYCFLDGYSGYNQIVVDPKDQEKIAFTCPFGVFAYRKMPFGLFTAPATFQRCMLAIFSDLVEKCIEIFMDDFYVFGASFDRCLENLNIVLRRCVENKSGS